MSFSSFFSGSNSSQDSTPAPPPAVPKTYCESLVEGFYKNLKQEENISKGGDNNLDETFSRLLTHVEEGNLKIICDSKCHSPAHMGYLKINPLSITLCDQNIENRIKVESGIPRTQQIDSPAISSSTREVLHKKIELLIKETLIHEMTHAYDYLNDRVDFNTCNGLAYTEIRAARNGNCDQHLLNAIPALKGVCTYFAARDSTRSFYPRDPGVCLRNVFWQAWNDHEPTTRKEHMPDGKIEQKKL